jgi:hypothetical protein
MDVRAAALWSGVSAGIVLAGLFGCQQGLQEIDSALRAAIDNDFSRAGDYKLNFAMTMTVLVAGGAFLFCIFFVIFLLKNARED